MKNKKIKRWVTTTIIFFEFLGSIEHFMGYAAGSGWTLILPWYIEILAGIIFGGVCGVFWLAALKITDWIFEE